MIDNEKIQRLNDKLCNWGVNYSVYPYNSYTINELLMQFFNSINDCIDVVNDYVKMVDELIEWVKKEGLENAVKEELENMYDNGKLADIINKQIFSELNDKINQALEDIKNNENSINDLSNNINTTKSELKELINDNVKNIEILKNSKDTTMFYILKNDLEYGDCTVIKADDGSYSMIDCMMEKNYTNLINQLNKIGVSKLKYLMITHDHSDHIGNAPAIINKYKPDFIVYKGGINYDALPTEEKTWLTKEYHERMIQACVDNNVKQIIANDDTLPIGTNDFIKVYNSHLYDYTNLNTMSLTFVLHSNGTKSVFTGDSTETAEKNLQGKIGHVDFYKLSHHGADGGNSEIIFNELTPRYCSANRANEYKTYIVELNCLRAINHGATIYTNDNNDMVVFKVFNGAMSPLCVEYAFPLKFIDLGNGKYKMTDSSGKIATNGIYPYKTDHYIIKDDGIMANNEWVRLHEVYYYALNGGPIAKNTFIDGEVNNKKVWYWVNDKGKLVTENTFIFYNNNYYVAGNDGVVYENKWCDFMGDEYYAGGSGVLYRNAWKQESDGKYYYLDSMCKMVKSTTMFINGVYYKFDDKGVCLNPNGEQK